MVSVCRSHVLSSFTFHAVVRFVIVFGFFFQAEDGIRDLVRSRGLGDVYKRQGQQLEAIVSILPERSDLQTVVAKGCQLASLPQRLSLIHI